MAQSDSEVILFNAMVLPMLMRDNKQLTTKETMIEFMGTAQPGRT